VSPYYSSATKRMLDVVVSTCALFMLAPLYCLIAAAVAFDDGFPIMFRQKRVGRGGHLFNILKFRSMRQSKSGTLITAAGDTRITRVGHRLRACKLDELPQFWNVLRGDMSVAGPRPEDPAFVDANDPRWALVLSARPGMTDFASLVYRDEELMLAPGNNIETYYRSVVLPDKLALSAEFLKRETFSLDMRILWLTVCAVFRIQPGGNTLRRSLLGQ